MSEDSVTPNAGADGPSTPPAQRPAENPTWRTDARKIFVGQILTILLTPASVAATDYLTELYKAPKPSIEYISATPSYFVEAPPRELTERIGKAWTLTRAFRDEFEHGLNPKTGVCAAWMDEGDWDPECVDLYRSSAQRLRDSLEHLIPTLSPGSAQAKQLLATPAERFLESMVPDRSLAFQNLSLLKDFMKILDDLAHKKQVRSGGVSIAIGVMNRGDSDGTVFRDATLRFRGHVLDISSEKYEAIKAHAFAEVSFTTPREDDGQYYGSWTSGQELVVKQWSDLIKAGSEAPFELIISLSDKRASIRGSVPKEE